MENTIENNKLIAEFMGYPQMEFNGQTIYAVDHHKFLVDDQLDFNKDWNLLMSLVEKIESFGFVFWFQKTGKGYQITIFEDSEMLGFSNSVVKIEAVYDSALKFIEWYNRQKQ